MRARRAAGRIRHHRLQPQGRPRARRGHQVPGLQRPQAPGGRRRRRDLFRAHRMRGRRAGRALPAADAGRAALARHPPHRPLRLDERHEARRAGRPGHRHRRAHPDPARARAARRPCRDRGQEGRRLLHGGAAEARRAARHLRQAAGKVLIVSQESAAKSLLSAQAVRERAHRMLSLGEALPTLRLDPGKLESTAQLVIDTPRAAYPTLDVPFHSRWRHFDIDGFDYWNEIDQAMAWPSKAERSRTALDLVIVSVLLDAGAGPSWRFLYPVSGETVSRSEGLALASLVMFRNCEFSKWPSYPLRVDAEMLECITEQKLAENFQVRQDNPLQGVAGRAELLRRLGRTIAAKPEGFGRHDTPRPGGLFDHLAALAENGRIAAPMILREVLTHLGPIWPSRLTLGGVNRE